MLCARLFGAAEVIALDTDETRLRVARERGLCRLALNPRHLGETEALVRGQTAGRGADAVIEAAGGETSFELPGGWPGPTRWWPWSPCMSGSRFCPCPPCTGKT